MFQFGKCLVEGVVLGETCLSGAEAVLGGEEFCEWAVDLISDDFFVGDEDVLEDGLVELAPDLIARAHVERVRIVELLVDYFEYGPQLWEGEALPQLLPTQQGEELEGLQLVVSLWVLRDIRFHILPGVIEDSKKKPLAPLRRERRLHAWEEFCAALALVENDEDGYGAPIPPVGSSRHEVDEAISHVPMGNDRALVQDALLTGMHVFMTCDKGVLKARDKVAPLGLLLASPLDLVEELGAAGALHCPFEPQHLYWPMPDQQRVSHLIQALDSANV